MNDRHDIKIGGGDDLIDYGIGKPVNSELAGSCYRSGSPQQRIVAQRLNGLPQTGYNPLSRRNVLCGDMRMNVNEI